MTSSMALSLGPVLDLIEPVMADDHEFDGDVCKKCAAVEVMRRLLPLVKALAEQHAAQLRIEAQQCSKYVQAARIVAAADFLCAPRREPEVADAKASE
jgi:hypothetical protein